MDHKTFDYIVSELVEKHGCHKKASFEWLRKNDPEAYAAFSANLHEPFDFVALARLIDIVDPGE